MFHYGIHPFAALVPDPFGYDRNQFHLDFFAVVAVQVQEGRMRGFADETEHVDAEVIKNQGRPSHGGDIKTVPAGRDTGEYKPVRSGKNRAGQQPGANRQGVMLEGQMNPQIHGAEKIADTVALHAIKTGGAIQHQHFEFMFVVQHLKRLLEAPCGCECDWPTSFQRLK